MLDTGRCERGARSRMLDVGHCEGRARSRIVEVGYSSLLTDGIKKFEN